MANKAGFVPSQDSFQDSGGLSFALLDHLGSSLGKQVKLLAGAVTLPCPPFEPLGKLPVEPGNVNSVGAVGSASFLDRSRTVIVGIVGHRARTGIVDVGSVLPKENLQRRSGR